MSESSTCSHPGIGRPRISIWRAFVLARTSSTPAGPARTISPPRWLTVSAILPSIKNASPPNIRFSVKSCSRASASRTRLASFSS
jgi:hypothetical protein